MIKPGAALVTGGAARLGRAMALALADDGWAVAVNYQSSGEEAEALVAEIEAKGQKAAALQADLLIEEDENRRQQSRNKRSKRDPPGREVDRIDQPTAVIARRL